MISLVTGPVIASSVLPSVSKPQGVVYMYAGAFVCVCLCLCHYNYLLDSSLVGLVPIFSFSSTEGIIHLYITTLLFSHPVLILAGPYFTSTIQLSSSTKGS